MNVTLDQSIAKKLLAVDLCTTWSPTERIQWWSDHLTVEERQHPLAQWILQAQNQFEWDEHIGGFLSAFWHLPPHPWGSRDTSPEAQAYRREALQIVGEDIPCP
ncbi:hypothetical protein [Sulfobacillus thermosulfidooxidans]|uniref:hypothetical protein n=1 Tax=Sulfobacillus thermosulfidooxidans TaxID=28034 RepID=UPI0006B437F1|nr:hypothetical protein [Sulfobacillus thermosulfidooxidans]